MNFDAIKFDAVQAAAEFETFRHWISSRKSFTERAVVTEISARRQMACLLGYTILMPPPDLIKFELGVKGLFKADLAVGNNKSRKFVLVEFEDAHENSLFKGGTRSYRHWSPRLEHGFGQILDWGWAKHTHPNDAAFMNSFGGKVLDDCYVVVCGRKPAPGSIEDERFDFRRTRLSLSGVPLQLYTYDNLVDTMEDILVTILARS